MDLSFCLYCEKHLNNENASFCSLTCQTNEASKPIQSKTSSRVLSTSAPKAVTTTCSYELAYHRRLSFSIANDKFCTQSSLSSSSSSSASSSSFSIFSDYAKHQSQNVYANYFD